jgi:hypothetical protein
MFRDKAFAAEIMNVINQSKTATFSGDQWSSGLKRD